MFTAKLSLVVSLFLIAGISLVPVTNAEVLTSMQSAQIPGWTQLLRNAGYVFAGTVISIHCNGKSEGTTVQTVTVSFRVDEPVRGVKRGELLTVREWAGLWSAGEHYRTGERVFLFLYAPSKLGLTSPVWGGMGRFAVDSEGKLKVPQGSPWMGGDDPISTKLAKRAREGQISQRELARALRASPEVGQ